MLTGSPSTTTVAPVTMIRSPAAMPDVTAMLAVRLRERSHDEGEHDARDEDSEKGHSPAIVTARGLRVAARNTGAILELVGER